MTAERQSSGDRETAVAREWCCKHVSTASYMTVCRVTHATIKEPLEEVISIGFMLWLYQEDLQAVKLLEETEDRNDYAGEDQQEFNCWNTLRGNA